MIDIRLIREDSARVHRLAATKNVDVPIDEIVSLDNRRREIIQDVNQKKARRNAGSKQVSRTKDAEERNTLIAEMKDLGDAIGVLDDELREVDAKLHDEMLGIPNLPDPRVPVGQDESANVVHSEGGRKRPFDFEPQPHWDLAESLGIIDFERGVKVAGTRSYVLCGDGSRLQRALITWMVDFHTQRHGYREVTPPYTVLGEMLVGTGQLPKFADTLFRDIDEDRWMIPTAEVPVTNLYRDEILDEELLPIYHVASTPCFRREQISAGRDVRGIKRGYQFEKVEMVKFVHPDRGEAELELLLDEALAIVNALDLPYRVLDLSTGDMAFASAHTYDVEVWAPGSDEWLEVSSASLMRDFQARRANLRFRDKESGRPQHLYTLNGSGLALPRTIIAILENYQRADGTIEVPTVLQPYLGGQAVIDVQPPVGPARRP